jgi:hypothetical protein
VRYLIIYGRGRAVGRARGVGECLGVDVGPGVAVGLGVDVGVAVGAVVAVAVAVGVGVGVPGLEYENVQVNSCTHPFTQLKAQAAICMCWCRASRAAY